LGLDHLPNPLLSGNLQYPSPQPALLVNLWLCINGVQLDPCELGWCIWEAGRLDGWWKMKKQEYISRVRRAFSFGEEQQ